MKTKEVKLNIEYRYNDQTVRVIKRIRNSFLLDNGKECYANELQSI